MPATYDSIATTTLTGTASEVNFTSIPNTFTDLRLVFAVTSSSIQSTNLRFNGDTATNYSRTSITGDGSVVSSAANINIARIIVGQSLSTPNLITVDIFSYAGSTNKSLLITEARDQNGGGSTVSAVAMWRSTDAITSIRFFGFDGLNLTGTATLYGILKA